RVSVQGARSSGPVGEIPWRELLARRLLFDKLDDCRVLRGEVRTTENSGGSTMQMRRGSVYGILGSTVLALVSSGQAQAADDDSIKSALSATKYIIDARLRTENVEQDGIAEDAHASTLRARLGFETGKLWSTSLLVEGEAVVPIDTDYRPDPLVAK